MTLYLLALMSRHARWKSSCNGSDRALQREIQCTFTIIIYILNTASLRRSFIHDTCWCLGTDTVKTGVNSYFRRLRAYLRFIDCTSRPLHINFLINRAVLPKKLQIKSINWSERGVVVNCVDSDIEINNLAPIQVYLHAVG